MTVIDLDQDVITMVNTFTVEPANQQRLVELIVEATKLVMRHIDGFVSANIHASLDGTRVVSYAQWRSEERVITVPEMHLYRLTNVEQAPAR